MSVGGLQTGAAFLPCDLDVLVIKSRNPSPTTSPCPNGGRPSPGSSPTSPPPTTAREEAKLRDRVPSPLPARARAVHKTPVQPRRRRRAGPGELDQSMFIYLYLGRPNRTLYCSMPTRARGGTLEEHSKLLAARRGRGSLSLSLSRKSPKLKTGRTLVRAMAPRFARCARRARA